MGNLPLFLSSFFLYGKAAVIKRHYISSLGSLMLLFLFSCLSLLFFLLEISHIVLTLSVHAGLFRCFHSPSNSAMDYRIFNACMQSFCRCIQGGHFGLSSLFWGQTCTHCSSCEKKSAHCSSCEKISIHFLRQKYLFTAVLVKKTHTCCSSCDKNMHSLQFL